MAKKKNANRIVDMSLAAVLLETDITVISRKAKKGVIPVKELPIFVNMGDEKEPEYMPVKGYDKSAQKPVNRTISVIDMEQIAKTKVFKFRLETKD